MKKFKLFIFITLLSSCGIDSAMNRPYIISQTPPNNIQAPHNDPLIENH